jgi:hypothetical protein
MAETFDPTRCRGGPDVVSALKEMGISVSQRLGARLHFLGRRNIRFSPAVLEGASPGSAAEILFLGYPWSSLEGPADMERIRSLLAEIPTAAGAFAVVHEDGIAKIILQEEAEHGDSDSAVEGGGSRGSLLPMVMGSASDTGFRGTLWDRRRLEESALSFLDAEATEEILENFRHLFRAAITTGQDPMPLLLAALKREKLPLSREVALLIKEFLNRELGRALQDLFSETEMRIIDALHVLLGGKIQNREILEIVLLPALTPLVKKPELLPSILPYLQSLVPCVARVREPLESFIDALLQEVHGMGAEELQHVSSFLAHTHEEYPPIARMIMQRLEGTADPHVAAFYGNILSRMKIHDEEKETVARLLVETFLTSGKDVVLQERLRGTFINLHPFSLDLLSRPGIRERMSEAQHVYLLELVEALHRTAGAISEEILGGILMGELLTKSRACLLYLSRSGLLHHPSLISAVSSKELLLPMLTSYLSEEALHLEEPDDEPVIRFLARLGPRVIGELYGRLKEHAALGSRSLPLHFRLFAKTAASGSAEDDALRAYVDEVLDWEALKEPNPMTIEGLGHLARVRALHQESVERILALILEESETFAPGRMKAALEVYRGPSISEKTRHLIEERFIEILRNPSPGRKTLAAVLDAINEMAAMESAPLGAEDMAVCVARKVLAKSREMNLHYVLKAALDPDEEGDGVRMPETWGREDRDKALIFLGRLASHKNVAQDLKHRVTARLFAFLEDWLEAVQRKSELYFHRETPLWSILCNMAEKDPTPDFFELSRRAGMRLLEVHRASPEMLSLERREDAQKFVVMLLKRKGAEAHEVRGMALAVNRSLLSLMLELASGDNPMTLYLLQDLASDRALEPELQSQLDIFFSFHRRES